MIWFRKLFGGLKAELGFILLLAVVSVGAWQYVQARHAERDRDDVVRRTELVCSAVGVDWTEKHARGPGAACALRARQLRTDREAIDRQTNHILSEAIKAQAARAAADAQAARAAMVRAQATETRMEKANADADATDHVRADWIAALNDLAGLRRPAR